MTKACTVMACAWVMAFTIACNVENEALHRETDTHSHRTPCAGKWFAAEKPFIYMQCGDGSVWKIYSSVNSPCHMRVIGPRKEVHK